MLKKKYQFSPLKKIFFRKAKMMQKKGRNVSNLTNLLKMVAVLVAAIIIGNWFLAEFKKARLIGKPWYQPYFSRPGLLIILALLLPIIVWIISKLYF